ncbi:MAG: hypothetical protein IKD12_03065 [Paludibacteraceae bacterium]|nr:hypothetical protein [Paludibacteraceae bacterium]
MKRCIMILFAFCCLSIYAQKQATDMLQTFLEQYGYMDMTNYNLETGYAQHLRNVTNCHYIFLRGKDYAPLFVPTDSSPTMNVRLNLIFVQKDDGSGNFQEDDEEQQSILDDAIADLNRIFSSLVLPGPDCFEGIEEDMVHDTRIRFVDYRYYIRKSSLWNNNLHTDDYEKLHTDLDNWYLSPIDDSINNVIDDSFKGINIYFTEDSVIYHHFWEVQNPNDTSNVWTGYSQVACSRFPSYNNWQYSSRIHEPCLYSKYWWMKNVIPHMDSFNHPSWESQVRYWLVNTISLSLAHELGHSFYLYHPQEETSYDSFYPTLHCSNTIMNNSGSSPRNFLHPSEIGRIYFNTMATNLQQYIPANTYLGSITLNSTTSLPQMRMSYSLLIGSLGNVTLPCDITFSPQGYIEVQAGGVLTVDGASLQSIQDSWRGIVVKAGGELVLSDVSISDYNIVVNSGGSLIVTNDLSISGDHSITIEDGGYLCVDENASIDLGNAFSVIIISPGAIFGCPSCNTNCVQIRSDLTNSGDGHFITYEGAEHLQNITISSSYMATGNVVNAGYDVTSDIPYGNVVIEDGGELRIKANETTLTKGVEVKLGGILIINNQ